MTITTQHAIVVQGRGHALLTSQVPLPALPEDSVLVKVKAVALNPTDWKHLDFEDCTGAIVGCDYAGVVEAVGSKVQKALHPGDRVAGFVHGCNAMRPDVGAFAQYVIAKGDLQIRVPDSMGFEAASTLGVGLATVGQNLYQSLQLPDPCYGQGPSQDAEGDCPQLLIYGGATATGTLAIQFGKLSGARVVTTCSEANRAAMYELGADLVFDYHDPRVGEQIREATDDALELVLDAVSTVQSAGICAAAISSDGGCYNALLYVRCPRTDVDSHVSMAYDLLGEPYQQGAKEVAMDPASLEFGIRWCEQIERLLQDRRIMPHRFQVKGGGLGGIVNGLQLLREGKVRACKLVYRVDETPWNAAAGALYIDGTE
ncbi:GroES-like protein [Aspergillus heteromorphus CBS 117.55]|uniref:GroES-like protein n=1 Tax=Aspergillus heteromorphus CBS 117.55 TaxID=1448321 RepID=A0A317WUW5_9EURO|nr:GroES-like protein [Aspergillus heteromorphus CBS 117.55]PWY89875.1 GroES-like protein [Aspergillus heteromorphus CBS 117.55]